MPAVAQSKYKAVKFSCKQRGPLLAVLYQCMALAAADGLCPIATKVLGWDTFPHSPYLLPCCKRLTAPWAGVPVPFAHCGTSSR